MKIEIQCANGHLACSSCHRKLKTNDKCPTCSIKSVLESLNISCHYKIYGCAVKTRYSERRSHEATCVYAPYTCAFMGCCNFTGSQRNLYHHLKKQHEGSVFRLTLRCYRRFHLHDADRFVVFLEDDKDVGAIFILNTEDGPIKISTIQNPDVSQGREFSYILRVGQSEYGSVKFESITSPFHDDDVKPGSSRLWKSFELALDSFFGLDGRTSFWLLIK